MCSDICTHSWTHHHNQDNEHFTPKSFFMPLCNPSLLDPPSHLSRQSLMYFLLLLISLYILEFYVNGIIWYVLISVWFFLNTEKLLWDSSRLLYVLLVHFFLLFSNIPLHETSQSFDSFTCWWTSRIFLVFGYYQYSCKVWRLYTSLCVDICFYSSFIGQITRNGIVELYGWCMFN